MNSVAPPPAAAGWYPDPDGTQRYWDGSQWLDIPAPPPNNSEPASNPLEKKKRLGVLIAVGIVLVLALGSGALVYKSHQDKLAAQEAAAIAQAEADALLIAAELELQEIALAEEEEAASAEEAAKKEADREKAAEERERSSRKRAVTNIEKSIEMMAKDDIKRGFITGEVLDVACVPVAGGSTDNLLQSSTIFECFVSTKDNKDGTFAGFYYKSTMNWEADSYTYEFGQP